MEQDVAPVQKHQSPWESVEGGCAKEMMTESKEHKGESKEPAGQGKARKGLQPILWTVAFCLNLYPTLDL